jgi:dihydroneopterin aldolase
MSEPSPAKVVATTIFVTGLKLEAEIGVYKHELGRAQPLVVDVSLEVDVAGVHRLKDTVNYEFVAAAARAIAAEGHIALVETFAERLAHACLEDPRVNAVRVRVEKPLALAPDAAGAGVEIRLVRG